ncbi:MAG: CaiB/BaiF CoA-transferase family protein [Ottowia sp.]|uniref:CaiB/BaiF CoA transferase family protein n=1 Tax=Ottowia sp. TaxID=1898956 RepID=UPI003C7361A9
MTILGASSHLPLDGILVLDLSWLLPGPFCTHVLSELGAEVIKVERPGGGDYLRELLPEAYVLINRGKKSVALDLTSDDGQAQFHELARQCDVIAEAFRPGVAKRLGIDYATLSAQHPSLVYLSISGYGQSGPLSGVSGHDVNYLALSGALSIPGHWGEDPRRSGLPMADLASSLYGAINVLAALRARDASGQGAYIDLSISESVLHWAQIRFADCQGGGQNSAGWKHLWPGNDVFLTADSKRIALGLVELRFWENFGKACDWKEALPLAKAFEDATTEDNRQVVGDRLRYEITQRIAARSLAYWSDALKRWDVPFSKVHNASSVLDEPQFQSRNVFLAEAKEQKTSERSVALPGGLYRRQPGAAPAFDEHGASIRSRLQRGASESQSA